MSKEHIIPTESQADVLEEANVVAEAVETTVSTEAEQPVKPILGIVSDCGKLNIRKRPSINGSILCEVKAGTELQIETGRSTSEWFKVCSASGIEGFCMKKYITLKQ